MKVEFIGQIELYYDRGNHHEFTSLVKELARPGELTHNSKYTFEFANVEKPFESYTGSNVRLRYFLKVTIVRRLSDIVKELELVVHTLSSYPDMNNPIKMEVGIEDCLHIEFEYNKSKYVIYFYFYHLSNFRVVTYDKNLRHVFINFLLICFSFSGIT